MLVSGYWILDAGYWMLDAGCWILKTSNLRFPVSPLENGIFDKFQISSFTRGNS